MNRLGVKKLVIDTNVFARYFLQDIPDQFETAKELFENIEQGFKLGLVSILVIDELIWVLEKYYELKRTDYLPKFLKLFYLDNIKVIETKKELILNCLEKMRKSKFDFTDLYLASITKKAQLFSFDKDFEKLYPH